VAAADANATPASAAEIVVQAHMPGDVLGLTPNESVLA